MAAPVANGIADRPRLIDTPIETLSHALAGAGITLDLGAMKVRLRSPIAELAPSLRAVYGQYPFLEFPEFTEFTDVDVDLVRSPGLRGMLRPSLRFLADGIDPFGAQPLNMPLPQLEWGINWCFATLFNQHLLLHAGTLEIGRTGLLLIGEPGSGKSTLTAALALEGARALSDEFGVLCIEDRNLLPFPKPIALKNRSIELIRSWCPSAAIGPLFRNTHKGDIAHMAIPRGSVDARSTPALPQVIIFPKWQADASAAIVKVGAAEAFNLIAYNSFNFTTTGEAGFDAIEALVRSSICYRMQFGNLEESLATLHRLCR